MKKITLLLVLLLSLSFIAGGCKEKQAAQLPPPGVEVVEVIQQDIPLIEQFIGETFGIVDIRVQARVEGFLEGMHFDEGNRVNKGQLLYTIDRQPFEAKVAAAMGLLAEANTMLVKAENDLARIKPLAEMNAVSKSDLDAAVAQKDAAGAAVDAAKASLSSARIELGYTNIYSPINGVIGKTEVYPGDFVGRGISNVILNEISRIDTVLVNFHIPEEKYLEIITPLLTGGDITRMPRDEDKVEMTMILADGTTYPYKGTIQFINRQVNPTTGTIMLQASFPNPDFILRPGQFAKVSTAVKVIRDGLMIPQRCAQELQGNFNVFVVNDKNEVEYRKIEVGGTYQTSYLIVTSGLNPGEMVVYEGLQKVKNGIMVNPVVLDISSTEPEI
jgi:membrane fusion protein (multidrug efflux system)